MLLDATDSQLVLIDYQERLMPAIVDGPAVLANARRLAGIARMIDIPVWGTEQNPARLGANDAALRAQCRKTLAKMRFSAAQEGLGDWLRPLAKPQGSAPGETRGGNVRSLPRQLQKPAVAACAERASIVIAGCEAHVCLLQTALDLIDDDFELWVVTDACGSRTERNRDAAFDRLAAAGAELVTTEMVAFEWLGSCAHPAFKPVLGLIK
ncbi:isochorismatase family protein [Verminephrobacter eiseniae]|uniref:isochorismatase family protein n=1 Tax=Verminephrobacter eiseniae TaxID=364317 RepID=UPI0010D4D06F|nr:isochorismatase family protein [Verminephrobacter eiseniae]KAB7634561.1 isochorismatase family protein [Verminephrobacter sp. Larva24]MCW5295360.1 isochorismatase family protein [Verminephrobacter eiseniae]MCW8187540.1 isochorismatase family protein [Verminephrobacter eiseniae]MCW8222925.1 isochorismatase family protein [Verminephrobacter eiseniae]